nr:MAG TPA: hypothetical protein [Crassvirales sp.]
MRWFIHYLRQAFCKHEWLPVQSVEFTNSNGKVVQKYDLYFCKKCLYRHKVKLS